MAEENQKEPAAGDIVQWGLQSDNRSPKPQPTEDRQSDTPNPGQGNSPSSPNRKKSTLRPSPKWGNWDSRRE